MQKQVQKHAEPGPMGGLLTIKEVAEMLRVKPVTIHSWIARGVDIPFIRIESVILFREEAIKEWIMAREISKKRRQYEA